MEDHYTDSERGAILFVIAFIVLAVLIGTAAFLTWQNRSQEVVGMPDQEEEVVVSNFEECAAHYPVMESYPRRCSSSEGETFVEDIGNELEKQDVIHIGNPRPNDTIESPLTILGEARGTWFFEASFPVRLLDEQGAVIAEGHAEAQEDWMTEEFVPFRAELNFDAPQEGSGTLRLEKDNPSGLPENDDALIVPVHF